MSEKLCRVYLIIIHKKTILYIFNIRFKSLLYKFKMLGVSSFTIDLNKSNKLSATNGR